MHTKLICIERRLEISTITVKLILQNMLPDLVEQNFSTVAANLRARLSGSLSPLSNFQGREFRFTLQIK